MTAVSNGQHHHNAPLTESRSSTVQLSDGHRMPLFGLGLYLAGGRDSSIVNFKGNFENRKTEAENAVLHALKHGYRLIDTAQLYRNEEDVGSAIRASGIPREQIYVVTKLLHHGYTECLESFSASLQKLGLTYVDLFLIHNPKGGRNLESYDAMIQLQKQGLIKSIGVSNFSVAQLKGLIASGRPLPVVNQIELHPFWTQQELVDFCRAYQIVLMGFIPLTRGSRFNHPVVTKAAKKHSKSPAQVLLRWSIQMGYVTIPKSVKPERIEENADIFGFELDNEDLQQFDDVEQKRISSTRTDLPWEG